jgi:hypothetical protein
MSSTECYGAVLQRAEDFDRNFDIWVITTDFNTIIKAPDSDVVLCPESESDRVTLKRLVMRRHESPVGCTMLGAYQMVRRHDAVDGWRVLRWPLVLDEYDDPISVTRVRILCAEHGTVLVDASGMRKLQIEAGGERALRTYGFAVTSSGDFYKFRWSTWSAAMQDWRQENKTNVARLVPCFTEKALSQVGYCVNPTNWPHNHPYRNILSCGQASPYTIDEILQLVALNKKLCPKLKPWLEIREYRNGGYEKRLALALEECFQNIHAVEDHCRKQRDLAEAGMTLTTLRFCRWLRAQARALNVKLPKPVKLSPKPTKKKR